MKKTFLNAPLEYFEQTIALLTQYHVYFRAERFTERLELEISVLHEEVESEKVETLKLELDKLIAKLRLGALENSIGLRSTRPWKIQKIFEKY